MNRDVTIPAAVGSTAGVYTERTNDETVFGVLSTSAEFFVQLGNDKKVAITAGKSLTTRKPFGRLTLTNTSASPVDVSFEVSTEPFRQMDVSLTTTKRNIIYPTTITLATATSILLGGTGVFTIAGKSVFAVRRLLRITNEHTSRIVDLFTDSYVDSFGWVLGCGPHATIPHDSEPTELYTSDNIIIENNSGGNVTLRIAEFFDLIQ